MKKLLRIGLSALLCAALLLSAAPIAPALADEPITEAQTTNEESGDPSTDLSQPQEIEGTDLSWTLIDGTLTISGSGEMPDYQLSSYNGTEIVPPPWYDEREQITKLVIGDGVTKIGEEAFSECSNLIETELANTITEIGEFAFSECTALTSFVFPSSVKTISAGVMDCCTNLSSVTISEGVESIEMFAFGFCSSLTEITLPRTIKSIANYVFDDTFLGSMRLQNVTILAEQAPEMDKYSFPDTVETIRIPANATGYYTENLPENAIYWSLSDEGTLTISGDGEMPDYFPEVQDQSALENPWLSEAVEIKRIVIEEGITDVSNFAFIYLDQVESVELPSTLTRIGINSFLGCRSLESIDVPASVERIRTGAFVGCESLSQVTLHEGLWRIGTQAFVVCPSLKEITFPASLEQIGEGAFNSSVGNTSEENYDQYNALEKVTFLGKNAPKLYGDDVFPATLKEIRIPENATGFEGEDWPVDVERVTIYPIVVESIGAGTASASTALAAAGETVQLSATAERGHHFDRWEITPESVTISGDSFTMPAESVTVQAIFAEDYHGKYSYEISTDIGDNGTLSVDRYATEGDTVTIQVTPDQAYKLDDLTVTAHGKDVALTTNSDGTFSLTMPSADVKISATFAEDPDWTEPEPEPEPSADVSDLFIDIAPDAWYTAAIQYAYDNGLMTGVSATEFAPEATTTRAMIVSILARLENVTSAEAAGFADVNDEWYATAVNWAANAGVVNGYEDNTFKPNTAITREQLAAILMNYASYKGQDVSNRADLTSYTDQPSTWAEEAMQWAVAEGLISGVTNTELQPQGNATRAQVAAILQRFLEA